MDGSLTRQVQSKVSQTPNKSKWAWKAFSRLRALSSRMTDQPQVETEELRFGPMGKIAVLALSAFPGVSNAYFTFILAFTFVVKHVFRAFQQHFPSCRFIRVLDDLHIKNNQMCIHVFFICARIEVLYLIEVP